MVENYVTLTEQKSSASVGKNDMWTWFILISLLLLLSSNINKSMFKNFLKIEPYDYVKNNKEDF